MMDLPCDEEDDEVVPSSAERVISIAPVDLS